MATIEQIYNRCLSLLELQVGLDVQEHAEDKIIEIIRGVYQQLIDERWWDEFLFDETYELDGTTGAVVDDISDKILRFNDIQSVFLGDDSKPLPKMTMGQNTARVRSHVIRPHPNAEKVFRVYPKDTVGRVNVWYRPRLADSVWDNREYDTEVPLDDLLLIYGTCARYLIDDGNTESATRYVTDFDRRYKQLTAHELEQGISKVPQHHSAVLSDWIYDPNA